MKLLCKLVRRTGRVLLIISGPSRLKKGRADELVDVAQEISKIMITEQTKLLAFTAMIQAARAEGIEKEEEAASQARRLVDQVHQLAEEIQKMIEAIQLN